MYHVWSPRLVTARLFVGKEGSSGLVTRRWGAGGRLGGRRETIGGYPLLLSSSPSHIQSSHTSSSPPHHTTDNNISPLEKSLKIYKLKLFSPHTPTPTDSEFSITVCGIILYYSKTNISVIVRAVRANNIQPVWLQCVPVTRYYIPDLIKKKIGLPSEKKEFS